MADESDARRDKIHATLQEVGTPRMDDGALLTGWAIVTQWVDPDGEVWIARCHSANQPAWAAKGMWHEALYGDWHGDD